MSGSAISKLIDAIEAVAAGILLSMALLTSVSVFTRYIFSAPIPDEYEISRLSLGIVACWGMAAAFRHLDHIQLDIFWDRFPDTVRRTLSRTGATICLFTMVFFCWALAVKVQDSFASGLVTVDAGLPIWIFHALAWLGTIASIVVLAVEVWRPSPPSTTVSAQ